MKPQTIPTLQQALSSTLFGSGATAPQNGDTIIKLDPSELIEITDQPFHAYSSDKLSELADSIRENGQQEPCIVRKKDGKYIVLAGRNRKRACERIGCKVQCIVRECSDAEADLILTDTNLCQRHELLPSELAAAYAMQKAAYEAKGERKSTAAIADAYGETVKTVYRYVKLNELDASLLPFVDDGRIPVMAGVTLTNTQYSEDQQRLAEYLKNHLKQKISMKQAEDLLLLEKEHCWYSDILNDFFAGKYDLRPAQKELKPQKCWSPADNERKDKSKKPAVSGIPGTEQTFASDTYQRMTHERCNGIKTGYWSPNTKEELIEQLAEFENAYPAGPEENK